MIIKSTYTNVKIFVLLKHKLLDKWIMIEVNICYLGTSPVAIWARQLAWKESTLG